MGTLGAASPLAAVAGAPILGLVVDRYPTLRKRITVASFLCAWAMFAMLPIIAIFARDHAYALSLTFIVLASAISSSAGSLLDAYAIEAVAQNHYGNLRVFGALGYGLACGLVGVLTQLFDVADKPLWVTYLVHFGPNIVTNAVGLACVILLREPGSTAPAALSPSSSVHSESEALRGVQSEPEDAGTTAAQAVPRSLARAALLALLPFALIIFLCGSAMGTVATFLFFQIGALRGGTQLVMGISVLVTTLFEIPVFLVSERLLSRYGPDAMLVLSLGAYSVRFASYWLLGWWQPVPSAWLIMIPEALHGYGAAGTLCLCSPHD